MHKTDRWLQSCAGIALAVALAAACDSGDAGAQAQASGATQESTAPCDVLPPLEEIAGAYDFTIGNALISDGASIVPLRAQHTFTANMAAQGDQLMMEADNSVVVLEYADPEDGALDFKELRDVLNIAPDDFPALLGCSLEHLPVLTGGGLADSQEGTPIEFEYELLIWRYTPGQRPDMMGTVSWSGGGIMSVRAVTASPSS